MCIVNLRYELQLNYKQLMECKDSKQTTDLLIQRSYIKDLIILALERQLSDYQTT